MRRALAFVLLASASVPAQELLTPGEQVLRELRAARTAGETDRCVALPGERPGERWLLKAPAHMWAIEALIESSLPGERLAAQQQARG